MFFIGTQCRSRSVIYCLKTEQPSTLSTRLDVIWQLVQQCRVARAVTIATADMAVVVRGY